MAKPITRQGLINYCLRKLGHPVVEINVDDDQVDDRVDEAFQYYRDFHYDATQKVYSSMQLTSNVIAQQYITLPEEMIGVERILQISNRSNGASMFDARYQLMLNNIQSLTNTDIIYYSMLKTELNLINDLMTGQKPVRFNRHMNRLFIDLDWKNEIQEGDYVIVEGWSSLDPDTYTDVYNDGFLKRYCTALIKQQWGINLKKFEGVQLPGGVTLNGQIIYNEATEEIDKLKQEVQDTYQLPIDFFTG
jgi:hypothetical protein